ncbi:uncharacterized protein EI90DRAFT_3022166 [Cantharellus anzutake]|uniref:uncharacterized protein n=1 Tax=Cantharellus anzutake TaxID=1750568 RepID=UPI0019086DBB|nr:uncharacterized protein EI90DRAFT_3022166 [Cantharellus anzutake]KAF8314858.1 hypothetical protein EI90DRAFT_3022166 [Cantharellus anzutake]
MSASLSSTAFQSRGFQAPSSSTPVQPPTVSDLPINTDVHGEADDSEVAGDTNNNGTDSDDPTPGDASTVKSIETSITKYAALYAIFHSPFLSKVSLLVELSSDFHSWAPTEMFSSVENFNQFCVHKILTMKYPILTNELRTHSGAMPWSAKVLAACYNKGIIVIIFGPSALNGPVSSIPFPGSPELENWEPAELYASQRALGSMYEVTEITPGTLAIVSMLVYFILSGDTEMVSGSGKPSATNYVDILLNFYHFILTLLHQEKTTTVQPMHKTMDWYKHFLFGPPAGAGDAHASGRAGSLSLGLSALLEEMELSGSNELMQARVPHCVQNQMYRLKWWLPQSAWMRGGRQGMGTEAGPTQVTLLGMTVLEKLVVEGEAREVEPRVAAVTEVVEVMEATALHMVMNRDSSESGKVLVLGTWWDEKWLCIVVVLLWGECP